MAIQLSELNEIYGDAHKRRKQLPYDTQLSICHHNIQSLLPKIDLLQYEIQPFDVFIFSETWLNNDINSNELKIINFKDPFRCDRDIRAGGVAIYVKENIACKRRSDLEINNLECVWIELKIYGRLILVAGIYRPPDASPNYWNLISESIDRAKTTNISGIIILGDLNNDMLVPSRCKKLRDVMLDYGLSQLINEPTHYTEISSTLIDVILTTNVNSILLSEVCDPFIPDRIRYHCPVAVIFAFLKPKSQNYKRRIWKYDEADYNRYRQILTEVDLYTIVNSAQDNVDSIARKLNTSILNAAEQSITNKIVTIRPTDSPWMHNEIRKLIRQRKRVHKQAKRTNNDHKWAKYRRLRNKVIQKARTAKILYETNTASRLKDSNTNVKTWWKLSKQILNIDNKGDTIPCIEYNGNTYETNNDKADALNSYFISQSKLMYRDNVPVLPRSIPSPYRTLEIINISEQEVNDVVRNLNVTKATGPDQISPRLLKEGSSVLCGPSVYSLIA